MIAAVVVDQAVTPVPIFTDKTELDFPVIPIVRIETQDSRVTNTTKADTRTTPKLGARVSRVLLAMNVQNIALGEHLSVRVIKSMIAMRVTDAQEGISASVVPIVTAAPKNRPANTHNDTVSSKRVIAAAAAALGAYATGILSDRMFRVGAVFRVDPRTLRPPGAASS